MRALVLLLAIVLLGCPAEDGPSTPRADAPTGEAVTFSDATKSERAADEASADPEPPASSSAPPLVSVDRDATVRDPRDGFLYLREGAGTGAPTLARMPNGTAVYVSSCQRGTVGRRWCRVVNDGTTGWAHESGLDLDEGAPDSPPPHLQATVQDPDGWTNLRASPSTSAAVVRRLVSGTPVTVGECIAPGNGSRSRWCPVDALTVDGENPSGWIAESRLRYE